MVAVDGAGPRTYGNWRRPTSPGILGLGSIGTAVLMLGLIVVVIVVMIVAAGRLKSCSSSPGKLQNLDTFIFVKKSL